MPGGVDHHHGVDEGVDQRREPGPGGVDGGPRPGGPQPGHDLAAEGLEGPPAGFVGLFGHQQDDGAGAARLGEGQGGGELRSVAQQGDDGVGGRHDGHGRPGDQAGEAGMAAGRPEPVPVETPPADHLHAVGAGGEADEACPGPEAGPADSQGRRHHLVGRHRCGHGGEALGQGQAAVVVADAGQHAAGRPGGQRQGGTVGGDGEAVGVE